MTDDKPTCGYCCDCNNWDAPEGPADVEGRCLLPEPQKGEECMASYEQIWTTPRFGCVRFEAAEAVEVS